MPIPMGSRHHFARVTEADVKAMRAAYREGKSVDQVWEDFRHLQISHSNVEKILHRLSWKHVE